MAIGIITIENRVMSTGGPIVLEIVSFAGDAAYPTGGMVGLEAALEAAANAGRKVLWVDGWSSANHKVQWVPSTGALKAHVAADLTEVPNATNLSAASFRCAIWSK